MIYHNTGKKTRIVSEPSWRGHGESPQFCCTLQAQTEAEWECIESSCCPPDGLLWGRDAALFSRARLWEPEGTLSECIFLLYRLRSWWHRQLGSSQAFHLVAAVISFGDVKCHCSTGKALSTPPSYYFSVFCFNVSHCTFHNGVDYSRCCICQPQH